MFDTMTFRVGTTKATSFGAERDFRVRIPGLSVSQGCLANGDRRPILFIRFEIFNCEVITAKTEHLSGYEKAVSLKNETHRDNAVRKVFFGILLSVLIDNPNKFQKWVEHIKTVAFENGRIEQRIQAGRALAALTTP